MNRTKNEYEMLKLKINSNQKQGHQNNTCIFDRDSESHNEIMPFVRRWIQGKIFYIK